MLAPERPSFSRSHTAGYYVMLYEEEKERKGKERKDSILFLSHYDELEGFEPFIPLCLVF